MTDIGPKRFRLIFRGELEPGTDPVEARARFRERFRVRESTLEQCFSGRKVALRSELSEAEAFRLQADLQEQGLVTRIEATGKTPKAPSLPPSDPTPANPASPEPASAAVEPARRPEAASGNDCRQCGRPLLPTALHCPYCGARQEERSGVWKLMAVLAAVMLLLIPLSALVLFPLLQQSREDNRVESAVGQGEAIAGKVREFMTRTGFRPNSNLDAGLAEPGDLARPPLSAITVSSGALITLRFQPGLPDLGGKTIVFLPRTDGQGKPSWVCRPGTLPASRLPSRCRPEKNAAPAPVSSPAEPPSGDSGGHDNEQSAAVARRVIDEEIQSSLGIRQRMLRFQARQGRWPDNNAELGLEEPDRLGSYAVREIRVQPGGELVIEFIASVAGDSRDTGLVLYRRDNQWRCRSEMKPSVLPENCRRDPAGPR